MTGTIELFINDEPGQEHSFALTLPSPIAYVHNGCALQQGDGSGDTTPVGNPATRPPGRPYPATTDSQGS